MAARKLRTDDDAMTTEEVQKTALRLLGLEVSQYVRLRTALGQRDPIDVGRAERGDFGTSRYSSGYLRPLANEFVAVATLLKTKTFKSPFRASLAEQVRRWCADPSPRHQTPLSGKQMAMLYRG